MAGVIVLIRISSARGDGEGQEAASRNSQKTARQQICYIQGLQKRLLRMCNSCGGFRQGHQEFSKVSSLLYLTYTITAEMNFENVYQLY